MYAVIKDNKVTSMVYSEAPTGLNLEGCELVESEVDVVGMAYVEGKFVESKSDKELASSAQAYLNSTDWIETKYAREVVRNKTITEAEFIAKYSDELDKREDAIALVSDYEDSL